MGLNTDTITQVGPTTAHFTPSAAHPHAPLSASRPKTRFKMVQNEQGKHRRGPEGTVLTNGRAVWYARFGHINLAGCTKPDGSGLLSLLWCRALATADWMERRVKGGKGKKRKVGCTLPVQHNERTHRTGRTFNRLVYLHDFEKSPRLQSFASIRGFTATLCTEQAN